MEKLKELIKRYNGRINAVYLHWTAGKYGQFFDDYHISIDADGSVYMPSDNLLAIRIHTWQRNTGAVAIALCCGYGAVANNGYDADFGEYPPTEKQIETLAVIVALFRKYGGVDFNNIQTHCEVAKIDGYGPYSGDPETRWDLWYIPDNASNGEMKSGGDVIRGKARWYLLNTEI